MKKAARRRRLVILFVVGFYFRPAKLLPLTPAHSALKTRVNALVAGVHACGPWIPAFAGMSGMWIRPLL